MQMGLRVVGDVVVGRQHLNSSLHSRLILVSARRVDLEGTLWRGPISEESVHPALRISVGLLLEGAQPCSSLVVASVFSCAL